MMIKMLKKLNFIKAIIVLLYIITAQFLWHRKEYVLLVLMEVEQNSIPYYMYVFGLGAFLAIILIAIIIKLINPRKTNKGIVNIGLKNSIGEYPREKKIFKDETKDNRIVVKLETRNIPLTGFQEKRDDLETVYNIKIDYIIYAPRTTKYVYIYGTPMKYLKPRNFELSLEDRYMTDIKNMLIMGKTRSGKSVFAGILLAKISMVYSNIYKKQVKIIIADFKNEILSDLATTNNYYGYLDAVNGINKVHSILHERIKNNKNDTSIIILLIDEYSSLLDELPKTEREKLKGNVGTILRSGSSKGVIPIVIDQEAYSSTFPNARHQFHTIVCFGNLAETQKDMILGDYKSQAKEINQCGEAYVYQEGEEDLTRIRVIKRDEEEKIIMNEIRSKMS